MEGTPGGLEGWDGRGEGSFGEIKVKEKKGSRKCEEDGCNTQTLMRSDTDHRQGSGHAGRDRVGVG